MDVFFEVQSQCLITKVHPVATLHYTQVAMPVMGRSLHAAVAVDRDLYILHGDSAGDMLREYAMVDTSDGAVANWLEPILKV
jgi:hypothetical protein